MTTNPAKIQAILRASEEIFGEGSRHTEPVAVESGVSERPFRNQEARTGVRNRVNNACCLHSQVDFWVAVEAGIDDDATFSWVVIDNGVQHGEAHSVMLSLPAVILGRVRKGKALGPAMSDYIGIDEIGHKGDTIDVFIAGKLTHSSVYHQTVILAPNPLHNTVYL